MLTNMFVKYLIELSITVIFKHSVFHDGNLWLNVGIIKWYIMYQPKKMSCVFFIKLKRFKRFMRIIKNFIIYLVCLTLFHFIQKHADNTWTLFIQSFKVPSVFTIQLIRNLWSDFILPKSVLHKENDV